VLVTGPDGRLVSQRAEAAALAALTLEFADGRLTVMPGDGASTRPAKRPASSRTEPPPSQGKLL
jgi:exodeoxyribonuclease VII large subunit